MIRRIVDVPRDWLRGNNAAGRKTRPKPKRSAKLTAKLTATLAEQAIARQMVRAEAFRDGENS